MIGAHWRKGECSLADSPATASLFVTLPPTNMEVDNLTTLFVEDNGLSRAMASFSMIASEGVVSCCTCVLRLPGGEGFIVCLISRCCYYVQSTDNRMPVFLKCPSVSHMFLLACVKSWTNAPGSEVLDVNHIFKKHK